MVGIDGTSIKCGWCGIKRLPAMPKATLIAMIIAGSVTMMISNSLASACSSVLLGGCYANPVVLSQDAVPLKQAVPMKAGLWRDELLDSNGNPVKNSSIESCRTASDWRDHALAAGYEASEGCSRTKLISRQIGNPPALQVGMTETCREGGKTLVMTSWLVRHDNANQPLNQYEMHSTVSKVSKNASKQAAVSADRTRHTWLSACSKT
jgi:hypothetical protein